MRRRHLIIFAKPPRLGRVKRRLVADIGTKFAVFTVATCCDAVNARVRSPMAMLAFLTGAVAGP